MVLADNAFSCRVYSKKPCFTKCRKEELHLFTKCRKEESHLFTKVLLPMNAGLEQLSRTQPAFYAYQKSLFNASTLSLDRGKLTPEELAAVNTSIASFLQLLSPHFLAPSCFKVLEYLIRKYRCPPLTHAALMNTGGMLLS